MSVILAAIPVWKIMFIGGLEISLLLFTENEIVFLKNVKEVGKYVALISSIATAISLIKFGLKGKEFKEKIDSLKGSSVTIEELLKKAKGSYVIPYNEIKELYVKKPKLGKGKTKITIVTSRGKKHEFNVGPADLYKGYSKEEIIAEILNLLKPIPKLASKVKPV